MRTIARFNPVSYVIEGMRSLVLEGFVTHDLLAIVGVIVGTGAVLQSLSLRALQTYDRD